jgi:hypothetical protein
MADKRSDNSKIIPLGQTEGEFGNEPYNKGRVKIQSNKPLKPS